MTDASPPARRALPVLLGAAAMAAVLVTLACLWPDRSARGLRRGLRIGVPILLLGCQALLAHRWRGRWPRAWALGWAGSILACIACAVPAFDSSDVHAYGQVGRIAARPDAQAWTHTPRDLGGAQEDVWFTRTWEDTPCVYGPLFVALAEAVVRLAGENVSQGLLLFRLWNLGIVLGVAVLLARRGRRALWLWLWSPFVLLHALANAHNDVFAGLAMLAACLLLRIRVALLAPSCLVAGAAWKLLPLVGLPFVLLALRRRLGWRGAGASLAMAGLVLAGILLAVGQDLVDARWDRIGEVLGRPHSTVLANLLALGTALTGGPLVALETGARVLGLALTAWILGRRALRGWHAPRYGASHATADTTAAQLAICLVGSLTFVPWYLLMVLPLALALPRGHVLRDLAVALSITWTLAFTPLGRMAEVDALLFTLPVLAVWGRRLTRWARTPGPRLA